MRWIASLSLLFLFAGSAWAQSAPLDFNTLQHLHQLQDAAQTPSAEVRQLQETVRSLQVRIAELEERIKKLEWQSKPPGALPPNFNFRGQPYQFKPNPFPYEEPKERKGTPLPNGGFFKPLSPASSNPQR